MRYVGIKNSKSKSVAVKKAPKKGRKVTMSLPCLTADDCKRHFEILEIFDRGVRDVNKMKHTLYYRFNKRNKKNDLAIQRKLNRFHKTYKSIKENGYEYKRGYIVLSEDGARVDGSHRSSSVEHLGFKTIDVLMIDWIDYCKGSKLEHIRKHLKAQQKKYNAL